MTDDNVVVLESQYICPHCGSDDTDFGYVCEDDDGQQMHKRYCIDCQKDYFVIVEIKYLQTIKG